MDIRTVAVIGADNGSWYSPNLCTSRMENTLYDAFPEGLERGMEQINSFWDKGIARGKTTEEQKSEWSTKLTSYRFSR